MSLSIERAATEQPHTAALVTRGRTLSYAELAERVRATLRRLEAHGLRRDDARPVALVAAPTLYTVEVLLALFEAEIPVLPLHARFTPAERGALLERCPPQLAVDGASGDVTVLHGRAEQRSGSRPLAILPTSGTSGRPKLVVLSRSAFVCSAQASRRNLDHGPDDRWLLCLPLAHVGGLSIVTRSLLARGAIVLFDPAGEPERRLSPATFERERVTIASLVPAQLERLLDEDWRPNPELRAVLLGGAALHDALLSRAEAAGVPVLPTYGLTEACSQVATRSARDLEALRRPVPRIGKLPSSGRPLPGIEVRVVDGIIQVRGPTLCDGYLDDEGPERTADGFMFTCDRGHLDADGELFVLGRAGDLIVSGGENVDPLEVENALRSAPGVRQACVFGVEDPTWGEIVAAVIVADDPAQADPDALSRFLHGALARFKHPRLWASARELPLLPSGKLDRTRIRSTFTPLLRPRSRASTTPEG